MRQLLYFMVCCFSITMNAQGYTSYFTGNTTDLATEPTFGVVLMGGASENDNAMRWFLERANGGDILVLRASGSDGYNDYFYSELGVAVNSVETIVINNAAGAIDNYVLGKIENAEAIWFAGGDQWNYVNYFKNTALEVLLNNHINVKQGVIGGTSAGMAILGEHYFSAENGTVTSAEALNNPYRNDVTIGHSDFLDIPFLENTITDTHFDSPDRKGRSTAFLARIATDLNVLPKGIASEEYTSVCVDIEGVASVFGSYPSEQDYAYFIRANCDDFAPETCVMGQPLEWNLVGKALRVYKVPGTEDGAHTFDLADWNTGTGGTWHNWWAESGTFNEVETATPECDVLGVNETAFAKGVTVYPNPASTEIYLSNEVIVDYKLYNIQGKLVGDGQVNPNQKIAVAKLQAGVYFVEINKTSNVVRFVKL